MNELTRFAEALLPILEQESNLTWGPKSVGRMLRWTLRETGQTLARGWISVEEQLPSLDAGFVLMYIDFNEPHTVAAIRLGYYDVQDGHWRTQIKRLRSHWQITHWMPLPETPDGAQEAHSA